MALALASLSKSLFILSVVLAVWELKAAALAAAAASLAAASLAALEPKFELPAAASAKSAARFALLKAAASLIDSKGLPLPKITTSCISLLKPIIASPMALASDSIRLRV